MNGFRPFWPNVLDPWAHTAGRSCKLRQKRRVNLMFLAGLNNTDIDGFMSNSLKKL